MSICGSLIRLVRADRNRFYLHFLLSNQNMKGGSYRHWTLVRSYACDASYDLDRKKFKQCWLICVGLGKIRLFGDYYFFNVVWLARTFLPKPFFKVYIFSVCDLVLCAVSKLDSACTWTCFVIVSDRTLSRSSLEVVYFSLSIFNRSVYVDSVRDFYSKQTFT